MFLDYPEISDSLRTLVVIEVIELSVSGEKIFELSC